MQTVVERDWPDGAVGPVTSNFEVDVHVRVEFGSLYTRSSLNACEEG